MTPTLFSEADAIYASMSWARLVLSRTPVRSLSHVLPVLFVALAACADSSPSDRAPPSGKVTSAILKGRPSGEDENAAVYIETAGVDENGKPTPLRCSGRIIAPGLVATARHCLLKRKTINVQCNPDGTPLDVSQAPDVSVEPAEQVTVFIGAQKSTARKVAVKRIFTEIDVSICRSDIAFLALAEPGLDTRTPIRRDAPRLIDTVSVTGWGYTSDSDRLALPDTRSTIEKPIKHTGPNGMPVDAFAIGGGSVCLGDSGAAALREGALLGVYSRIDDPNACDLAANRNIFVWVGAHLPLVELAFASLGETPWYEGERPPWLAKAGAACMRDEECMSANCNETTWTCATPCGDAGLACPARKICNAEQACVDPVVPPPPPAPEDDGGCTTSRAETTPASAILVAAFVTAAIRRRRRSRH